MPRKPPEPHPGFDAVAAHIAAHEGVPIGQARAMLASSTRHASGKAKAANPALRKVRPKK